MSRQLLTLMAAAFKQLQACNVKTTLDINGTGLQACDVKTTLTLMAVAFKQLQARNVKTTLNINGSGLRAASSLQCQDNS